MTLMKPHLSASEQMARHFLIVAVTIEILLVTIFFTGGMLHAPASIVDLFDLDGERNIPALFSSAQLFLLGIVFLSLAYRTKQERLLSPPFLAVLGIGCLFLSCDEGLELHEKMCSILNNVHWLPRFKDNHGAWVAPYLVAGLIFLIFSYGKFLNMWKTHRRQTAIMASGFAIFLIGAAGLEVVGYQFLCGEPSLSYFYQLEVALEEFLEMIGISITVYGAILLHR